MKKQFPGCTVEFIKGGGGNFDVRLDGSLIYSKSMTGRFPENSDVMKALQKRL